MFVFAFFSAWMGATTFVVIWALVGLLLSKRSFIQSAALVTVAVIFGPTAVMWYIAVWWILELCLGLWGKNAQP